MYITRTGDTGTSHERANIDRDGTITDMGHTVRLAALIRAWREQRGLSINRARRLAGVTRVTWTRWEQGTLPYRHHWPAIERTIGWRPGSVAAVLGGGDPTPADEVDYTDPETGEVYDTDEVERRLWELWPAMGMGQAREHIRKYRRDRAARRGHELHTPRDVT